MKVPILRGKNVVLRPLRLSDAPAFCRWFKDPSVTRFLQRHEDPPSLREERAYVRSQQRRADHAQWAIIADDGVVIGTVSLEGISREHHRAEYGIFIGDPKYWGQGYGTAAGRLVVRFGFQKLRLRRIYLNVYAYNTRGFRSYRRLGFRREGRLRNHLCRDGYFHDVLVMGLLREEFLRA